VPPARQRTRSPERPQPVARSYPDLNLQLGAGFNCATNGFISVEIKGFSLHTAVGEEQFAPAPAPGSPQFQRNPVLSQERNQALYFCPGLFPKWFFFLKNSYKLPVPFAVCKNCGCPAEQLFR